MAELNPIRIALPGASGRMGRMLTRLVAGDDSLMIVSATAAPDDAIIGQDLGLNNHLAEMGVVVGGAAADLFASKPQLCIDFTAPEASVRHAELAAAHGVPMVIGTTGLNDEQHEVIRGCAQKIPIVICANTSVGITLLRQLVEQVAAQLVSGWDIEIVETHHKHKIDAPSGTALALGEAAAKGRGVLLGDVASMNREGKREGARLAGNIGFAVMRGGNVAGEHSVIFYGDSERVELTHRATDRIIFAQGAVRAGIWVLGQDAGLYAMDDVLKV